VNYNFEGIKIVSLNDKSSVSPDPKSELMDVVLDLSSYAPDEWADYFNSRWSSNLYGFKRTASISGDKLKIRCELGELEKEHLPALKRAIAQANSFYHEMLNSQRRADEAQAAKVEQQNVQLAELKKKLTFD